MRFQVKQWGNSAAIRLPQTYLAQVGAYIGGYIELRHVVPVPGRADLDDFPFIDASIDDSTTRPGRQDRGAEA